MRSSKVPVAAAPDNLSSGGGFYGERPHASEGGALVRPVREASDAGDESFMVRGALGGVRRLWHRHRGRARPAGGDRQDRRHGRRSHPVGERVGRGRDARSGAVDRRGGGPRRISLRPHRVHRGGRRPQRLRVRPAGPGSPRIRPGGRLHADAGRARTGPRRVAAARGHGRASRPADRRARSGQCAPAGLRPRRGVFGGMAPMSPPSIRTSRCGRMVGGGCTWRPATLP